MKPIEMIRTSTLVLLAATLATAPARAATVVPPQELVPLRSGGATSVDGTPPGDLTETSPATEPLRPDVDGLAEIANEGALSGPAPAVVPNPANSPLSLVNPGFSGFDGLTHRDQRFAGTGKYANTQFSLEPPDQGLCVGNGFVLEAVNTALAVYSASGAVLKPPTALSQFFQLAPEIIRGPSLAFGDFTSDPRCLYDAATDRWFLTLLQIGVNPKNGAFLAQSSLLIAVSQTGDPTGAWNISRVDTTNHGAACPCFGDQPLIGTNRDGFYISTNAFPLAGGGFSGVQLYAISKEALAEGAATTAVHLSGLPSAGFPFSVQPAVSSQRHGEEGDGERGGGTELFAGLFDLTQAFQNKLSVWALNGTRSLRSATPQLTISTTTVETEVFTRALSAFQKPGPTSLRAPGDPIERLDTGGTRLQQVTFAKGKLWTSLTTAVEAPGETRPRAGVAYFIIDVESEDDGVQARIANQGYVAVDGANTFYSSVGVGRHGKAVVAFSLVGPTFFPSVGYVQLDEDGNAGPVHIAASGVGPDDGFTGYPSQGGTGISRWGDYSTATLAADGSIWFANEYIPNKPRSLFANWGTFISRVATSGEEEE